MGEVGGRVEGTGEGRGGYGWEGVWEAFEGPQTRARARPWATHGT